MTESTDPELVAQAQLGSGDAAEELFRRHWDATWRVAFAVCGSRAMADDMAQDAFLRAMSGLASFNGRASFGTWVQRIAVNRTIDALRRERRLSDLPDEIEGPVDWARQPYGDRALMTAVGGLPLERRVPIVLRYWFDYTPAEIAEALGVPAGTIASRLSRALDDLRVALEERDERRA